MSDTRGGDNRGKSIKFNQKLIEQILITLTKYSETIEKAFRVG